MRLFSQKLLMALAISAGGFLATASEANRITYLDGNDPFYVHGSFPKLTTAQWLGESEVDAVVILAIDDMRTHEKYEEYLRPILEELKQVQGRAPVSIMSNSIDPNEAHLQRWLEEGVSLEVHTLSHPCPLLAGRNFDAAAQTYHGGVELLNRVPNNRPVAFRMPCCDSMNSPSPRFYAEVFNRANAAGQFLTIDSSIMNITTSADKTLPPELTTDADGTPRFRKYIPSKSFVTTIDNYPYPYVIGKLCWQLPPMVPSDWEAQHRNGPDAQSTVVDLKAALDVAVLKRGVFPLIFHPHGWLRNDQVVELIRYGNARYGKRVRYLNFVEVHDRLIQHLLADEPLRGSAGHDNGVRLLDVNNDGYIDVIIGNARRQITRIWKPALQRWHEVPFPAQIVSSTAADDAQETGLQFGIAGPRGFPVVIQRTEMHEGAWEFNGENWVSAKKWLRGFDLDATPIFTRRQGRDRGVRFRDFNGDGQCELFVANPEQNAVFSWLEDEGRWQKADYSLPAPIVNAQGKDNGVRFVDLNEDAFDDFVFSNPDSYGVYLFTSKPVPHLDWGVGWSQKVRAGRAGDPHAIPLIVREGPYRNNGVWFHSRHMWVQNEDTADLPDKVERVSFERLLAFATPEPKSPDESLASMELTPGFVAELAASEPLIQDPVAFEWAADGKLWVVEMRDYPSGSGATSPGGAVRVLEDHDKDGFYEDSTVFMDGLNFPTGVMPWKEGVLISAAPQIIYAEDTDNDGRADLRRVLFEGFGEGNQQHRVNGFDYGLDHWVYGANGDSDGVIRQPGSTNEFPLSGHDFRFRPDTGEFDLIEGETQFGRHRDDWGNWFGNNNPTWLWQFHLPERYVRRNPYLAVRESKRLTARYPNSSQLYSISAPIARFNWPSLKDIVTSANSAMPYRDILYPELIGSVFISEPAHNVVHREVLSADGVSFQSRRAPGEEEREFIASRDSWFRPTMIRTGPDGALYVADMYRLVIEHPEYALPGMERQIDLRAGTDRGRLYRVRAKEIPLRPIPDLSKQTARELALVIESANGWQRDTAQRLLIERQGAGAISDLEDIARSSGLPQARLQALWTLRGLGGLQPRLVRKALQDDHPAVREHAIRLSEDWLSKAPVPEELLTSLAAIASDPSVRVRYQLAFTLGEWRDPRAGKLLAQMLVGDQNPDLRMAILSSALPHLEVILAELSGAKIEPGVAPAVGELVKMALYCGKQKVAAAAVRNLLQHADEPLLASTVLTAYYNLSADPDDSVKALLPPFLNLARSALSDDHAPLEQKLAAVRLIALEANESRDQDALRLARLLQPQVPADLQKEAIRQLGKIGSEAVASDLLLQWERLSPFARSAVLEMMVERSQWALLLLASIERGGLPASQVDLRTRQSLLTASDRAIQERARALFQETAGSIKLDQYAKVDELVGNPAHGAELFRQQCATCHRFGNEGSNLGPSAENFASKPTAYLLASIMDPNQAVEIGFVAYEVRTKDGRELVGIIEAESSNSLTLRMPGGLDETVLRRDIESVKSSGLSLMPEGFDQILSAQDSADLLSFLRSL